MAITAWNNLAGVWDTDANWSGSHPADGDTAIFRGGSQSVTTPPGTTDEDINIYIENTFTGNLGSSGNEIQVRCNKLIHEGAGSLWFDSDAGTNEFTDVLVVNSTNTTNAATLGGDEIARIVVMNGKVTISGSLTHDFELYVAGPGANVVVEANAGGTAGTSGAAAELRLVQSAGTVTSNVNWDSAFVSGGTFNHDNAAITYLNCTGGTATLKYNNTAGNEVSGDLVVSGSGVVDLTQNITGSYGIAGDLVVSGNGTLRYRESQLTVTGNTAISGGNYIAV